MSDPADGPFDDVIPATERGGYLVASVSQPGAFWLVQVFPGRLECPCPRGRQLTAEQKALGDGWLRTLFCRHGTRLLRYITVTDQAKARPTAPPNVAALTD